MNTPLQIHEAVEAALLNAQAEARRMREEQIQEREVRELLTSKEAALEDALLEARHATLERASQALRERLEAQEVESRQKENAANAQAYEPFDVTTRQRMWESAGRSTEPSPLMEAGRNQTHREMLAAAQQVFDAHADFIQDNVQANFEAIRQGREIDLGFLEQARRLLQRPPEQEFGMGR